MRSMNSELPLARRDLIADRLANGMAVVATELANEFDVSEDAIRRDLRALAAEGRCRRVYGGALPIAPASNPMSARITEGREQKSALGRLAATTAMPGELIFLDNGSTNLALVDYLPEDHDLTIATNSIDIAAAVLRRPELKLIMIGGCVDPVVGGAIDATATTGVSQMNIDRCFLGACSVSATQGVCAFNAADGIFRHRNFAGQFSGNHGQAVGQAISDQVASGKRKFGSHVAHRNVQQQECKRAITCISPPARTPGRLQSGAALWPAASESSDTSASDMVFLS